MTDAASPSAATDVASVAIPWRPSPGLLFGLAAGIVVAGIGVVFSRPELMFVALPILISVVWAFAHRPREDAAVRIQTTISPRGEANLVDYRIAFDVPAETESIVVRLYERGRVRTDYVVDPATARDITGQIEVVHSGSQELIRIDYSLVGPSAGVTTAPAAGPRSVRVIPPHTLSLRRLPLPFRMFGLSGGHDSSRPGDGGDFRDINLFAAGDRLRRIDWRVTARRAQGTADLYVRRSFATADATVLVVMDSRDDVSELVSGRGSDATKADLETSLDIAREAATSIVSGYFASGDRVGFRDLAVSTRLLAPGGGRAHLHRLLSAIARTRPLGAPQRRVRAPLIPSGSIVYVLSTFLDGEATRMAEVWRVSGHRVVAVDTLPPTDYDGLRREQLAALRVVLLEREARILSLSALGVDVVRWRFGASGSPEVQLSTQSRAARRPR